MTRLIIIFSFIAAFSNCNTNEPNKTEGVPNDAFWVGGKHGGQWHLIENINSTSQTVHFKIYHPVTGEILLNKLVKLNCNDLEKEIDWENLEEQIKGVDWGIYPNAAPTIHLKNNSCHFE